MSSAEHIEWAKERAFRESVPIVMWMSFVSDLSKEDFTKDHVAIGLGNSIGIGKKTLSEVKKFIEGFLC